MFSPYYTPTLSSFPLRDDRLLFADPSHTSALVHGQVIGFVALDQILGLIFGTMDSAGLKLDGEGDFSLYCSTGKTLGSLEEAKFTCQSAPRVAQHSGGRLRERG